MDFLYLSPEFPPYSRKFIQRLARHGVRVWAVGEADFYDMPEDLREDLEWYVRADLKDPIAVRRAVEALLAAQTSLGQPPNIDRVESHNESWLRLEGFINTAFDVPGIRPEGLDRLKKKSEMKTVFRACGFPVAEGEVVRSIDHALALAHTLGYPVILKPDEGVGAGGIYRVDSPEALETLVPLLPETYLLERFMAAPIVTFDGLVDAAGHVLFENSLVYGDGVLDYVLGKDTFFYVTRRIPHDLLRNGRRLVEAFEIRGKFFHFEFFRVKEGYYPIEINCRPPGGPILDMMNFSADVDLYDAYARMVQGKKVELSKEKKYYCCYLGRRERAYSMTHNDVITAFGGALCAFEENPPIFQQAMGRYRYILRSAAEKEIFHMADRILETLQG
jgi:predicted ATP-grasp superfamily ATP-dependent carboligase